MSNLHLHLAGKVGELLYASGCLPAIRARWPGLRLVLHLHPHYVPLVAGLLHQPDDVEGYPIGHLDCPSSAPDLATQVTDALRHIHTRQAGHPMVRNHDGDWHCNLYGLHQWYANRHRAGWVPRGFWTLFQDAADAGAFPYECPSWGLAERRRELPTVALAFASGNRHTRVYDPVRQIGMVPAEWGRLADELRGLGLDPTATGHRDDPRPDMPGWTWIDTNDPRDVLRLILHAERVVGLNSGIVWAACLLAPGRVTMLDTQERPEYRFQRGYDAGLLEPARHHQIPWTEAEPALVDVVRAAML